jgi:hypothetical protein
MNNIVINRLSKYNFSHSKKILDDDIKSRIGKTAWFCDKAIGQYPKKWVNAKLGDSVTRCHDGKPISQETIIEIRHYMFNSEEKLKQYIDAELPESNSKLWLKNLKEEFNKAISKGKSLYVTHVASIVDKLLI